MNSETSQWIGINDLTTLSTVGQILDEMTQYLGLDPTIVSNYTNSFDIAPERATQIIAFYRSEVTSGARSAWMGR